MAGIWRGIKKAVGTPSSELTRALFERFKFLVKYDHPSIPISELSPVYKKEHVEYTESLYKKYIAPENEKNDSKKKLKRKYFKFIFDLFNMIDEKKFDKINEFYEAARTLSQENSNMKSSTLDKLAELIKAMLNYAYDGEKIAREFERRYQERFREISERLRNRDRNAEIPEDPENMILINENNGANGAEEPRGAGAGDPSGGGRRKTRKSRKVLRKRKHTRKH